MEATSVEVQLDGRSTQGAKTFEMTYLCFWIPPRRVIHERVMDFDLGHSWNTSYAIELGQVKPRS